MKNSPLLLPLLTFLCPESLPVQTYKGELSCNKWDKTKKREGTPFTLLPALSLSGDGKRSNPEATYKIFNRKNYTISCICQVDQNIFKPPESHFLQPEWNLGLIQYYWAEERFITQQFQLFWQGNWELLTSRAALVFLIFYDEKKKKVD